MTCDQFTDLVDLYAVGSVEKAEADALRAHLDTGCEQCGPRFIRALMVAASVSETVPLVEPPPSLRDRIAASVGATVAAPSKVVMMPQRATARRSLAPWLVAAASVAALAIGIGYEENARRSDAVALSASLEAAQQAQAEHTAAMLSILQAPGTKTVAFNINESNLPHGSLFIHKNLGVAMVVAHLPSAPAGWKYESWIVPKNGAPQPVESFATDNTGFAFTVVKGPVDVSQWSAVAVSMEPKDSNPVKPTKVVYAAPVNAG
jgi:hypothetical protein